MTELVQDTKKEINRLFVDGENCHGQLQNRTPLMITCEDFILRELVERKLALIRAGRKFDELEKRVQVLQLDLEDCRDDKRRLKRKHDSLESTMSTVMSSHPFYSRGLPHTPPTKKQAAKIQRHLCTSWGKNCSRV